MLIATRYILYLTVIIILSACNKQPSNPIPKSLSTEVKNQQIYNSNIPKNIKVSGKDAYQKSIDYTMGTHHTTPDLIKAVNWIKYSANEGYAEAQYKLAIMYLQGIGVPISKKNAFLSMLIAAQSGDAQAQYYLSYFYRYGIGTTPNFILADYWLKQAKIHGAIIDTVKMPLNDKL
ncbi:sel1 repeat family protein [Thiotrichales bacterium 19S9-12]|nr:sel1 repeat family protein [Thiotrichales bacterium 19S9-11]MCF6811053.1 sel1 repeat family protein [Thiotrichales bacterium 19S9-12]